MIDRDEPTPSEADLRLDLQLQSLQQFAPRAGFADRVMARVSLGAPVAVAVRKPARPIFTPARLWWASGLAAASSAALTVTAIGWMTAVVQTGALAAWLAANVAQTAWVATTQAATAGAQMLVFYALAVWGALGNAVFPLAAACMFLPMMSAWGLYFTLKQTSGKRIAAHAAR